MTVDVSAFDCEGEGLIFGVVVGLVEGGDGCGAVAVGRQQVDDEGRGGAQGVGAGDYGGDLVGGE